MFQREKGFTLIEMLIVLMVITVLILLFVLSLTNQNEAVHEKGCDALVKTVQAQVHAYELDNGETPRTLYVLEGDYISKDQRNCQNGDRISLDNDGTVSALTPSP